MAPKATVAEMIIELRADTKRLRADFKKARRLSDDEAKKIGKGFRDQFGETMGQIGQIRAVTGEIANVANGLTEMGKKLRMVESDAEGILVVFESMPFGIGQAVSSVKGLFNELSGAAEQAERLAKFRLGQSIEGRRTASRDAIARGLSNRLALATAKTPQARQAIQNQQQVETLRSQFRRIGGFDPFSSRQDDKLPAQFQAALASLKELQGLAGGGGAGGVPGARTISLSRTAFGGPGGAEMGKPINERQGTRIIELLEQGNTQGATAG